MSVNSLYMQTSIVDILPIEPGLENDTQEIKVMVQWFANHLITKSLKDRGE